MRARAATLFHYGSDAFVVLLAAISVGSLFALDVPGPDALLVPLALFWSLPLLLRRRFPLGAPATVFAALATASFVEVGAVTQTAGAFGCVLFAFWALGVNNDLGRAFAGLLAGYATVAVVVANDDETSSQVGDFFWVSMLATFAWLAGVALYRRVQHGHELHARAERAEREREVEARAAVVQERSRIARELHDVVAHSVSVMTVQAGGVRRLLRPDQERERAALETIEETGRQALAEMRRLLGMLRSDAGDGADLAPQPGLAEVDRLVEQVRAAGLPVELRVEGEPVAVPPGIDLSAYRIVQEALTNALKHAGPARATVALRYRADELEVDVANDGRTDEAANGAGHGLAGMHERVAVYGGRLEAGPRDGGGFGVRATLPLRESAAP